MLVEITYLSDLDLLVLNETCPFTGHDCSVKAVKVSYEQAVKEGSSEELTTVQLWSNTDEN